MLIKMTRQVIGKKELHITFPSNCNVRKFITVIHCHYYHCYLGWTTKVNCVLEREEVFCYKATAFRQAEDIGLMWTKGWRLQNAPWESSGLYLNQTTGKKGSFAQFSNVSYKMEEGGWCSGEIERRARPHGWLLAHWLYFISEGKRGILTSLERVRCSLGSLG